MRDPTSMRFLHPVIALHQWPLCDSLARHNLM
jgi:hypothetical protein